MDAAMPFAPLTRWIMFGACALALVASFGTPRTFIANDEGVQLASAAEMLGTSDYDIRPDDLRTEESHTLARQALVTAVSKRIVGNTALAKLPAKFVRGSGHVVAGLVAGPNTRK